MIKFFIKNMDTKKNHTIRKKYPKYKRMILISFLLFCLIIAYDIFNEKGILTLLEVKKDKENLIKEINKIKKENEDLREKIKKIKNDKFTQEKLAREKLFYSRKGEKIILIPIEEKEKK